MSLFERLKQAAPADWNAYVDHAFVRGLGDGTLPQAAFRQYLVQDYLFLIQFARAHALAAYKARTLADMRAAKDGLAAIVDVEMQLHLRLCERWGLSAADVEATAEHPATVAYTRWVLDIGMSGDLLDLQVALSPCTLGYAEIGRRLAPQGVDALGAAHPYREWIGEYAGAAFQQVGQATQAWLDDLGRRYASEARFDELVAIFAKAARLEADFWQMGLDAARG
ncbi:thiaminase II [Xanthomonas sp. XNM01]|uniref:thiaminase II n=1 Tax=Xanthomonas sp. XNM01 TaxID=2769289 RepID=UPI00178004FC|nr:thiaminase II [Xanthomonas sp. XNM01]MBD9370525.1 thiaminase II [Xanthomonas sp. XNM01]